MKRLYITVTGTVSVCSVNKTVQTKVKCHSPNMFMHVSMYLHLSETLGLYVKLHTEIILNLIVHYSICFSLPLLVCYKAATKNYSHYQLICCFFQLMIHCFE